jgi:hypothetical protein
VEQDTDSDSDEGEGEGDGEPPRSGAVSATLKRAISSDSVLSSGSKRVRRDVSAEGSGMGMGLGLGNHLHNFSLSHLQHRSARAVRLPAICHVRNT